MKLFHGTSARFSHFSLDYAGRPGMSGNGHLGVWLAVDRSLAENFGGVCLEVEADIRNAYTMPLAELAAMNTHCCRQQLTLDDEALAEYERVYYTEKRQRLIAEGYDFIFLKEGRGTIDMGIGLIPERLTIL